MIVVFVPKAEVDFLIQVSRLLLAAPEIEQQPFLYDLQRINRLATNLQGYWQDDIPDAPLCLSKKRWQIVLDLLTETAGAMQAKDVIEGEHIPGINYQAFYVKIRKAIARQEEA